MAKGAPRTSKSSNASEHSEKRTKSAKTAHTKRSSVKNGSSKRSTTKKADRPSASESTSKTPALKKTVPVAAGPSKRSRIALFGFGFVGEPLVDALRERCEVVVFGRDSYDALTDDAPDLSGFDVVVNLIGVPIEPPWTRSRMSLIRESRVKSAAALSLAATRAGAFFVQSSGSGIHTHGFLREVGEAWESAVCSDPTKTAICRFGLVIGDGGVAARFAPIFCMGLGGVFGSGSQRIAWIARDQLTGTLVRIIEGRDAGVHELSHIIDARGFFEDFARALGKPCLFRYPEWLLRLMMPRSHALLTADTGLDRFELEDDDSVQVAIERSGLCCS